MTGKEKAYIAGFLYGDGSIMLQLKPRKVVSFGFRVKTVICFYQDTRHEKGLIWIRKKLGIGYLSRRKDHITELRIEGYKAVGSTLKELTPYIIFKRKQVEIMLRAISIMQKKPKPKKFLEVCQLSDRLSSINYATVKKKYNCEYVRKEFLKRGLIPL